MNLTNSVFQITKNYKRLLKTITGANGAIFGSLLSPLSLSTFSIKPSRNIASLTSINGKGKLMNPSVSKKLQRMSKISLKVFFSPSPSPGAPTFFDKQTSAPGTFSALDPLKICTRTTPLQNFHHP